ncbi:protelomerase family protein [Microvirga puerhi]|uniref:Telomere resolvase n=1 Tax=Microvirga puerhi TaxID=2876078 RepID=A0ABS7VUU7_9HYPH|nr:protelomerase family protein [Microvirga puerhi]MBZ6078895.1 telomere resolvase [Microvirga puerhi]
MAPRAKIGRPSTIQAQIESFVERLRAEPERVGALWAIEWLSLANRAITTRTVYISHYRNAVKTALGKDHPALAVIRAMDRVSSDPLRTYEPRAYGGRKKTRADRIERFAEAVSEAIDEAAPKKPGKANTRAKAALENTVRSLWDAEMAEMIATLKETTILTTTSAYRNALREKGVDDEALLALVTPPVDMQKSVTTAYRDRVIEQHHDLVAIPQWDAIRSRAEDLLPKAPGTWASLDLDAKKVAETIDRYRAVQIGLALGFLTGRRPFEVFCQGEIEPLSLDASAGSVTSTKVGRGFDNWHVLFSGQAKTRGRDGTAFDKQFAIPVLTKARDVIFGWKALRYSEPGQVWQKMSHAEFKADLLIKQNPQCLWPNLRDEIFEDLWPKPQPDDTKHISDAKILKSNNIRSFYAEVADNFFRPKSKTKSAYFADILGHTEKDIETASSYMRYYLPDQKTTGPTRRVKRQLSAKIEAAADQRAASN